MHRTLTTLVVGLAAMLPAVGAVTQPEMRVSANGPTGSIENLQRDLGSNLVPVRTHSGNGMNILPNRMPRLPKAAADNELRPRFADENQIPRQPKRNHRRSTDSYIPTLHGYVIYADSWDPDYPKHNLFAFRAVDPLTFSAPLLNISYTPNGGGVRIGDRMHIINYSSFLGVIPRYYYYDFNTGWVECEVSMPYNDLSLLAVDMTYDSTDGKTYSIFYNDDNTGYELGTMDWEALENSDFANAKTSIGIISPRIICIAADTQGQLYGIRYDGMLVKVDKQTAAVTPVGDTGLGNARYMQSATIDPRNGRMYWAYTDGLGSALYEVDLHTAQATLVGEFTDNEEIVCLYVPEAEYADDAPAAVSDMSVNIVAPSCSGTVSFTLPAVRFDEQTITGQVSYAVLANGETVASGQGNPGQDMEVNVTLPDEEVEISVKAACNGHEGPAVFDTLWVGYDYPSYVYPCQSVLEDNKIYLNWSEYEPYGENGGYLDPADITYEVVYTRDGEEIFRLPVEDTHFEYEIAEGPRASHVFEIYPYNHGKAGYATLGASRRLGTISLPFEDAFEDAWAISDWDSERYDEGFDCWFGTGTRARCWFGGVGYPTDEWYLTPEFELEAGKIYPVTFDYVLWAETGDLTLNLKAKEQHTQESLELWRADIRDQSNDRMHETSIYFSVPQTGIYRIGLRALGYGDDAYNRYTEVDNFRIGEAVDGSAADAPADFVVTGFSHPDRATISLKAPAQDLLGNPLETIDKVVVQRDYETVHEFEAPAPGESLFWEDSEAEGGTHTYSAFAVTSHGNGKALMKTVFVGVDAPVQVAALNLTETGDKMRLYWDAPTETAFGDPLDASYLWYTVYIADSYDINVAAEHVTDLHWDDELDTTSEPHPIQYAISASTTGGESEKTFCHARAVGRTVQLPWVDNFAEGTMKSEWWQMTYLGNTFWPTEGLSSDGDGFCAALQGGWYGMENCYLCTPKLDVSKSGNPTLLFDYVGMPAESQITVYVTTRSQTLQQALTIDFANFTTTEWHTAIINLNDYIHEGDDFVVVQIETYLIGDFIVMDNMRVMNAVDGDISVSNISAPAVMGVNNEGEVNITLSNNGAKTVKNGRVNLIVDGNERDAFSVPDMAPFSTVRAALPLTALPSEDDFMEVEVEYVNASDADLTNNVSETVAVRLVKSDLPVPAGLTGTAEDGGARLEWTAPAAVGGEMTESFENYEPFITSGIGAWTTMDRDRKETYTINGLSWPNAGQPMAYMVWDLEQCRAQTGAAEFYKPLSAYTGKQCLVSIAADGGDYDAASNDLLVSPLLTGEAQTISFMARTYSELYGLESIEVLVSNDGTKYSNFKTTVAAIDLPCVWTQYNIELPEGAKYFAIRKNTMGGFVMMLDDIRFTAAEAPVQYYRIYRDGQYAGRTEGTETTYLDAPDRGSHAYAVTAVSEFGESPLSNQVVVATSGVNGVNPDCVKVEGGVGEIRIYANGNTVTVVNAAGTVIWSDSEGGTCRVPAEAGCYIVTVGNKTYKVIAR